MKNARLSLEEFIATSFRDPKQAASVFTADGTFEPQKGGLAGVPGDRVTLEEQRNLANPLYGQ
jgi:hypothetical protein